MLSVSGAFVNAIGEWLAKAGYRDSPLCRRVRHIHADQNVDLQTVEEFLREAVAISNQPLAPVQMGQLIDQQHLGPIGHLLANARTLEELLNSYVFYESLFYGESIANVRRDVEGIELYWGVLDIPEQYARFAMSSFAAVLKRVGVPDQAILSVSFPFDDEVNRQIYLDEIGCVDVHFHRDLGLQFDRVYLQRSLQFASEVKSRQALVRQALLPIEDMVFAMRLYDEIVAALPPKQAHLNSIAAKLAMSARTLQRRLNQSPDGLRGIVHRIRMQLAAKYLLDRGVSLVAVSLMLGYSKQSAFQLAFKKHYGVSPGQWRKRNTGSEVVE